MIDPEILRRILMEVLVERERQDDKWGEQNHTDGTGGYHAMMLSDMVRATCEAATADGSLTWKHILHEEVCEAFAEEDPLALRAELVQVAAVAAAWVEAIDRRQP